MTGEIESLVENFFTLMGIQLESCNAVFEDENRGIVAVTVQTPDSRFIIGIHGATLLSITHLLSRMLEKKCKKSLVLHLEVNDYMQSKHEKLYRYVDKKIELLQKTGGEIVLGELSSYERKRVHDYLNEKNVAGLESFSSGEGQDRRMHLSLAKHIAADTTILEDGVGI